ncbi:MAG: hypothetical protein CL565_01400 [Alphaproteobacteria bacterium]|nr:hypothetical protein [Alphaproteobacteria bacterium]
MDRHVNYTIVGAFVLAGLVGIFAFLAWYAGSFDDRKYNHYTIHFSGSVNGLSEGGQVNYKGVDVGRITDIRFEPSRPDTIMVDVEVDTETPVTKTTDAQLKPKGITGVAFIELVTENLNAGPIERQPGQKYPVIEASSSTLDRLFDDVPEIIDNILKITEKLEAVINKENMEGLSQTLDNISRISQDVAAASAHFEEITQRVNGITVQAESVSASAQETAERTSELVARLDKVLARNENNVDRFFDEDLRQFSKLIEETRDAAAAVNALARELKDDPSSLIYKKQKSGVELPR